MNGKVVFGNNFANCLKFVLNKAGTRILDTNYLNTPLETPYNNNQINDITQQFKRVAQKSQRIKKPVMHLSLSPHPDDNEILSDSKKKGFAEQLLKRLNMENCQWILAEHHDTFTPNGQPRPHLHLIINRIPINQKTAAHSSFIKRRIEKELQTLRQEYGLKPIPDSRTVPRKAPNTGQTRRFRRQLEKFQKGERILPPELPIITQIQNKVDEALTTVQKGNAPNIDNLINHLKNQGINTTVNEQKHIFYQLDKSQWIFSGSKLGTDYTINGLKKRLKQNQLKPQKQLEL